MHGSYLAISLISIVLAVGSAFGADLDTLVMTIDHNAYLTNAPSRDRYVRAITFFETGQKITNSVLVNHALARVSGNYTRPSDPSERVCVYRQTVQTEKGSICQNFSTEELLRVVDILQGDPHITIGKFPDALWSNWIATNDLQWADGGPVLNPDGQFLFGDADIESAWYMGIVSPKSHILNTPAVKKKMYRAGAKYWTLSGNTNQATNAEILSLVRQDYCAEANTNKTIVILEMETAVAKSAIAKRTNDSIREQVDSYFQPDPKVRTLLYQRWMLPCLMKSLGAIQKEY